MRVVSVVMGFAILLGLLTTQRALSDVTGVSSRGVASAPYCVIDSRGSGEGLGEFSPPGASLLRVLRQLVAPAKVVAVTNPYPARGSWHLAEAALKLPTGYHPSVVAGKDWLAQTIANPPATCRDAKLILTGYSQGAQVTGDVYQGGGTRHVVAVVLFGDPYFNGKDSEADRGSYRAARHGGLGTRAPYAASSRGHVFSYCHADDPVCQNRSNPIAKFTWHNNYDKLNEPGEAANAIAKLLAPVTANAPERDCGSEANGAGSQFAIAIRAQGVGCDATFVIVKQFIHQRRMGAPGLESVQGWPKWRCQYYDGSSGGCISGQAWIYFKFS